MSGLSLSGLSQHVDGTTLLDDITLDVAPGSMLSVVGPSGCGKTSLLRAIAGLAPATGTVQIDDVDVTEQPAALRDVGIVFQHDVLFPQLSVRANIEVGCRRRGLRPQRRTEAVDILLLSLGLVGVEDRLPGQLSGGQQRRVSIARALASQPAVLLLDEPMNGLDDILRSQLSHQLAVIRQRYGTTMVHVTHDADEALGSGDTIAVMAEGRLLQHGSPREVFSQPRSTDVAAILGHASFLSVTAMSCANGHATIRLWGRELSVPCHDDVRPGPASLVVHPGAIGLSHVATAGRGRYDAVGELGLVTGTFFRGDTVDCVVETDAGTAVTTLPATTRLAIGDQVQLRLVTDPWLLPAQVW